MVDLSIYFDGAELGACDAVHNVIQEFWKTFPQSVPLDQGTREVFDLELRKNLAEFTWQKNKNSISLFYGGAALLIALIIFGAGIIRCREENKLNGHYHALYAVHGEWSTRTIQLWNYLSDQDATVILLGRPVGQLNIKSFRKYLTSKGINTDRLNLIRPFNLSAYKKTIISSIPEARKFIEMLECFTHFIGFSPNIKQLAKILYRLLLGRSYKFWMAEQDFTADMCIFGHSGVADSGSLDYAFRERGITTKHWFHGASHGQNFFGYSSVAICKSKHDKELTDRLGGYERATFIPQSIPIQAEGGCKWLLMTNWLHPQNRHFKRFGVRDELMLMEQVASAAKKLGFSPDKIVWKPHPVFDKLSTAVQKQVRKNVAIHGFKEWTKNESFESISKYSVVLCTVSTTIIDTLKLGVVPIVHVFQSFDDVIYVNALPKFLLVKNAEQMIDAIQKLSDPEFKKMCFHEAWHSLMPSANEIAPENL